MKQFITLGKAMKSRLDPFSNCYSKRYRKPSWAA